MTTKLYRVDFDNGESYDDRNNDCVIIESDSEEEAEKLVKEMFKTIIFPMHTNAKELFNKWIGFLEDVNMPEHSMACSCCGYIWKISEKTIESIKVSPLEILTKKKQFIEVKK